MKRCRRCGTIEGGLIAGRGVYRGFLRRSLTVAARIGHRLSCGLYTRRCHRSCGMSRGAEIRAAAKASFGQGEAPGNGEEVAQGVGADLRQADKDQGIGPVIVGQVVGFGRIFDEAPAVFPGGSYDECGRFRRGMGGDAGKETAAQLEYGRSIVLIGGMAQTPLSDVLIEENRVSVGIDGDKAGRAGGALVRLFHELNTLGLQLAL